MDIATTAIAHILEIRLNEMRERVNSLRLYQRELEEMLIQATYHLRSIDNVITDLEDMLVDSTEDTQE